MSLLALEQRERDQWHVFPTKRQPDISGQDLRKVTQTVDRSQRCFKGGKKSALVVLWQSRI